MVTGSFSLVSLPKLSVYTKWAKKVTSDKILCAACGFESCKAPSHSSYYDFIDRLWLASSALHKKRKRNPESFYSKLHKKLKAGQKLPPKHSGSVKKFALFAERNQLRQERAEKIFQDFLARCLVDKSADMGILGDLKKFSIAMDGSCYNSGASHHGIKACDCRSKGITTVNVLVATLTLMPVGVGIATMSNISMVTHCLIQARLTAHMTLGSIYESLKLLGTIVFSLFLHFPNLESFTQICRLKVSLPMEPWIITTLTACFQSGV